MAEKILRTEYSEEMQKSYMNYSMSVITARAIPDARDGLKPVQRRVLYDMSHQFTDCIGTCAGDNDIRQSKQIGKLLFNIFILYISFCVFETFIHFSLTTQVDNLKLF